MIYTLPITLNPPLKCYLWELHLLGIVFGRDNQKPLPWLFNHYYQIFVNNREPVYLVEWDEHSEEFAVIKDKVLIPYNWRILKDAAEPEIVISIIRNMLKRGFYCTGNLNEKYIPGLKAYEKQDLPHAFMIYGIDEEDQKLFLVNYLEDENIGSLKVDYQSFFDAVINQNRYGLNSILFSCYQINPDFNYDCFDPKTFMNGVEAYLSWQSEKGIYCIYKWLDMLQSYPQDKSIDKRNAYLFAEHKTLMEKRLNYMQSKGFFPESNIVSAYHEVAAGFEIIKMLTLKYNMTRRAKIIEQITKKGLDLLQKEQDILRKAYFDCLKRMEQQPG